MGVKKTSWSEADDIPLALPDDEAERRACMKLIDIIGQRAFVSWYQGHLFFDGEKWVLTGSKLRHDFIRERHLHCLEQIVGRENLRLNVERVS